MIKLMDILKEISGRYSFSADEGEPDTGQCQAHPRQPKNYNDH